MTHPIAAYARGWIGTRFHHQGRLKKTDKHNGGVDCLGLLIGVAGELHLALPNGALLAEYDERDYSHQPDGVYLRNCLKNTLTEISQAEMQAGDIALLRIDHSPQHLAVISDYNNGLGLIHAYAQARAVVEHAFDDFWKSRLEAVFRF